MNKTEILAGLDAITEAVQQLKEEVAQQPDGHDAGPPEFFESEVNRRVAARLRSMADDEDGGDGLVEEDNHPVAEVQADGPGFPRGEDGEFLLPENVEEANRLLDYLESVEYAKDVPNRDRLRRFQRHALQLEEAHR